MPGGDRTGPWGEGPRSGWTNGRCAPSPEGAEPAEFRRGGQRGFRRGRCSFGRGRSGLEYRWGGQQPPASTGSVPPTKPMGALFARLDERLSRIEARIFGAGRGKGAEQGDPNAVTS